MIDLIKTIEDNVLAAVTQISSELNADVDYNSLYPILEFPRDKNHGDIATSVAMKLARVFRKSPHQIGQLLCDRIRNHAIINSITDAIEIAGAGFINFSFSQSAVTSILQKIILKKSDYGITNQRTGEKIILEFVSANPTGPLNAVNARAAAVGDVLANILQKASAQVHREFYINDVGNQVDLLGRSVKARYEQALNIEVEFPEDGYHGEYITDMAKDLVLKYGSSLLEKDPSFFAEHAITHNVTRQKTDLEKYNVRFDTWFSEKTIHNQNLLDCAFKQLQAGGYIYEKEGKQWFASTRFGDDNDRVMIRDNGIPTYFMADTAYHQNKFDRSFNHLIDIWGPDHHGYIPRMSGVLQALGHPADSFTVLIVQQVNLLKDGQPYKMSKRAGRFILMEDVIEEVGTDAARFFFVMRTSDSQLDFDLDLAKKHTADNPCFYVQYAHARIHSIYTKYEEQGYSLKDTDFSSADLAVLSAPEELDIIKKLGQYPQILASCAQTLDVHHLPYYLYELSSLFHNYYNLGKERSELRIVSDNEAATRARLALVTGLKIIIGEGLSLLGVSAPESM
ncbi:MAG: arginine--tRNA ligase [Candidatus Auribacterota bacterium]|nr:arginine--tRNA ligase [Candidatus Auribacterota bacterium]